MPATLKETERIKAELLRGSEDWVVGEGIKTLNEQAPYSLGNRNKDTPRTTNTVQHFSYILPVYVKAKVPPLSLSNSCYPAIKELKYQSLADSCMALSFGKSTAGWCGFRQLVLSISTAIQVKKKNVGLQMHGKELQYNHTEKKSTWQ